MNFTALYLKRLGLEKPPTTDLTGLSALHRAQVMAIAFENVEPFLGRPVLLNEADLQTKILEGGRGGYCFELNSLFLRALHAFGFEARPHLARVFMSRATGGPRTHQVSLVALKEGTWLADVGFGGPGLVSPIPYDRVPDFEGEDHGRKVRLRYTREWGFMYEDLFEGSWRKIYGLPDERTEDVDITVGNHYCSTHAESIFRQNLYCALPIPDGRITVWNRSLQIHRGGRVAEERLLSSPGEFRSVFRDLLRVPVSDEDCAAIHRRLPETR